MIYKFDSKIFGIEDMGQQEYIFATNSNYLGFSYYLEIDDPNIFSYIIFKVKKAQDLKLQMVTH